MRTVTRRPKAPPIPVPPVSARMSELRRRIATTLRRIGIDARDGSGWERIAELEIIADRLDSITRMFDPPDEPTPRQVTTSGNQ